MYPLNIQDDLILIKDIKPGDLYHVFRWYNLSDEFKFATGIETKVTFKTLSTMYMEIVEKKDEFFAGIYIERGSKIIGLLKGRFSLGKNNVLWLSVLIIDPAFQNMGYGSKCVNLLLKDLKIRMNINTVFVAVVEENVKGKAFWVKQGFLTAKKMVKSINQNTRPQRISIMRKNI